MRGWRVGLWAMLVAALVLSGGDVRAQGGVTEVRIRVVAAFPGGELDPQLRATDGGSGGCFAASAADPGRSDAYRCMAGNRILDPCFVAGGSRSRVVCVQSPWATDAITLAVTGDLPARGMGRQGLLANPPWGLELANGMRCSVASTGAGGVVAGERVNYSCVAADGTPTGAVVIGDLDRAGGGWRVFLTDTNPWVIGQEDVAVAWY